jgi:hypothetical protein
VNAFWSYFWPAFGVGLLLGVIAGVFGFRPRAKRKLALGLGVVAAIAAALLWHGPLGAADRFAAEVERNAQRTVVYYEVPQVTAHLHRGPLTRQILLSGPADDFQRVELVRLMQEIPGVEDASWSSGGGTLPLIAEGGAVSVLGFLFGLLLAYLVELRRRYNAQWNW